MAGSFGTLRKKPKHVRDNIAFSVAGGFTLAVAIAWFVTGFGSTSKEQEISTETKNGAFTTLLDQIKEQVATVKESVEQTKATSTASTTTSGGWNVSTQTASTSEMKPKEAMIMVVSASSSSPKASSTVASTSVLY